MSTNIRTTSVLGSRIGTGAAGARRSYFEQQREILIDEIAMTFEHVLANINKLNRSLEAVITVGNEFSSVEALWSQFESVMGKEEEEGTAEEGDGGEGSGAAEGEADEGEGHETAEQEDASLAEADERKR